MAGAQPAPPNSAAGATDASFSDHPGTPTSTTRSGSGNLADVQDAEPVATCAILLPKQYAMKEGQELWGGVRLGKLLGAGVQAKVFELAHSDGRPTGKVLKIGHTDLGHKILNSDLIWIGMEREWEIGTQLRAALEEPGGKLPGFMKMCDCLVRSGDAGDGIDKAHFSGMIMEKLNGWEVYKRIDVPEFHNIHYVREMLFQVFSALDRAQRKLGFHHADLGMRNVMEHYPRLWEEVRASQAAQNRAAAAGVAAGGGSSSRRAGPAAEGYEASTGALPEEAARQAGGRPAAMVVQAGGAGGKPLGPGDRCFVCEQRQGAGEQQVEEGAAGGEEEDQRQPWWRQRTQGSCGMVRPKPGFSCNADGSRLPLGPNVEFKIIDFGVAAFDQQLAQAAGGYESEEVMARLNDIFAAKHITFGPHKEGIQMETSDAKKRRTWHLLPTGMKNRFRVKQTPAGAAPLTSAKSLQAHGLPAAAAEQLAAVPEPGAGGSAADDKPQRFRSATLLRRPGEGMAKAAELMRQSGGPGGQVNGVSLGMPNPQRAASRPPPPKQSPIERMHFWERKGDVVWPKEDERDVQLFITLVHHVTGVRMKASFAAEGEGGSSSLFGRLACGTVPRVKEDHSVGTNLRDYGRWGKWGHWFRRMHIRWSAHMKPFNSGLLAAEALCSPFFGAGRVQHAKLPVCVEQAFPRS
ncbi:expressed protein [Chlorella variabilis]|uniref:Expressed protein n=1 Tax=Chlorella variabilis TaxID=554065 RepID=E1ZCW9_CHLVA|nr:expressed protein [Chlorella variabilis]EFN56120.1 expressed protein [Chlorella variabilis]|eukprot:XP_005848222.1 expressed protein [Chlorella variabilis]